MSSLLAVTAQVSERVGDGPLLIALVIAFAAGVLSFLSPCVLPLVPAYLSFTTGMSAADLAVEPNDGPTAGGDAERSTPPSHPDASATVSSSPTATTATAVVVDAATPAPPAFSRAKVRRRVLVGSIGFVLGTAVVFVSFGALFGSFGEALRTHAVGLSQIFGALTIVLGLLMAGVFERFAPLQRDVRIHRLPGGGLAAAPILGFTFALGWTPCIGPTLGTVLGLSASTAGATAARGAILSIAYCLGLGLPLLITGLAFTRAMAAFAVIRRHYRALMVTGGACLVLLGVLQVTGTWTAWTNSLQTRFGGWDLPL